MKWIKVLSTIHVHKTMEMKSVVQSEVNKLMQLLQQNPVINPSTWAEGYSSLFV